MDDPLEQARLTSELFGKSATDTVKFVKDFAAAAVEVGPKMLKLAIFSKDMEELGVKFKDAKGNVLSMEEVLGDVADKFKTMPDGVDKTRIAMDLFGRSGKDMIPVLNLGKEGIQDVADEAKKLGFTFSGDNVSKIKDYERAQKSLGEAVGGLQLQL